MLKAIDRQAKMSRRRPRAPARRCSRPSASTGHVMSVTGTAKNRRRRQVQARRRDREVTDVDAGASCASSAPSDDTELTEHPRRSPIFDGNQLEVKRGVNGTSADGARLRARGHHDAAAR